MTGSYVVDTTFFTQAHRMDYPLSKKPSFWKKIKQLAAEGTIVSLDRVWVDIQTHDTELKIWCQDNLPQGFFKPSFEFEEQYREIVKWTIAQIDNYLPVALEEFLSNREPGGWLVAYALENNCTVVTYESNLPEQRDRIKIPEVCGEFGIPCINTAKMFSQLGLPFFDLEST